MCLQKIYGDEFFVFSDEAAQRTLDVNIAAHFWTVKAFLPAMVQSNSGHLVTIASAAATTGPFYFCFVFCFCFCCCSMEIQEEMHILNSKQSNFLCECLIK